MKTKKESPEQCTELENHLIQIFGDDDMGEQPDNEHKDDLLLYNVHNHQQKLEDSLKIVQE